MRTSILYAAVAMTLFLGDAAVAADSGLMHRVGKMEETIFGAHHKQHALPERINQLEKETIGTPQTGPLSKRLEHVERIVNGHSGEPAARATAHSAASPASSTAKHKSKPVDSKATAAKRPDTPIKVTTSDFMPPIAPQVDPSANHPSNTAAPTAASTAATQNNVSEVTELIRSGTAAHQAGNSEEAEKIFKNVLTKSPFNSNACFNLGAIAEGRGDLAAALGNYRTALIGAPNDPQIQEAIAQVESQISQKQDSPFKNPLGPQSIATTGTLLQGNANVFDPLAAQQQASAQANQNDPPSPPQVIKRSGWRTAGAIGAGLIGGAASGAARGALRGAISGGGNGALSGALSSGGRGALRGALRAATSGGRMSGGGAAVLNGLHCPLCRLLPF
jgi:hypothetical protein